MRQEEKAALRERTVAEARKEIGQNAHTYHGISFVSDSLGLNNPETSFVNSKVALLGLPKGRSKIAEQILARGGEVTEVGMEKIATNARTPFFKSEPLPQLEKGTFDTVASYLGVGIYFNKGPMSKLFRSQAKAIDDQLASVAFDRNGECHFFASDFTETDKAARKNGKVNRVLAPVHEFMKTAGLNRYQGQTLLQVVEERIKNKPELEAIEIPHVRPTGKNYGPEIRDLYFLLGRECNDAIAELAKEAPAPVRVLQTSAFMKVKKHLAAGIFRVDNMLVKPQNITPPVWTEVIVRRTPLVLDKVAPPA